MFLLISILYILTLRKGQEVNKKKPGSSHFCVFPALYLLFKLGKFKDVLKYICLIFVSFLPLFYLCYIYYFGSLIFCCQFVANFIILRIYHFTSIIYIAHLYKSPHTFVIILFPKIQFLISIIFFTIFYSLLCPLVISSTSRKLRS